MGLFKKYFDDEPKVEFTSIILDGREVSFTLIRKRGVKNINFSITPQRGLRVTVPYSSDISRIYDAIYDKEKWILKHLNDIKKSSTKPGVISYLGKEYELFVVETVGREKVNPNEGKIIVQCKSLNRANKILERWFRKQAKETITNLIDKYRPYLNSRIGSITIKGQKTRWGSCSSQNNLNFNWKLMMAPLEIIEYVVVHELSHTIHHNHSERFWNLVASFDPNYKKNRKWLKNNGHNLSLD